MKHFWSSCLLFVALAALFFSPAGAYAADLEVACDGSGSCVVDPADTPLFSADNLVPGQKIAQTVTVTNTSAQAGDVVFQLENALVDSNLADAIVLRVFRDATLLYGPSALSGLFDTPITLESLAGSSSQEYIFELQLLPNAGDELQGKSLSFDIELGFFFEDSTPSPTPSASPSPTPSPTPTPTPTSSPSLFQSSGTVLGSSTGSSGPPTPPVCSAQAPTTAPTLLLTSSQPNSITLSWSVVSPVTHYAIVFTRQSDGAQYGSANIGATTTYTVNNLAAGSAYTFQVFGVNDCAPGSRSNEVATGLVAGVGGVIGDPVGADGQVLGDEATDEDEDESLGGEAGDKTSQGGLIGGVTTDVCQAVNWLPIWVAIAMVVILVLLEWLLRYTNPQKKYFALLAITLTGIAIVYFLGDCNCLPGQWLEWLCLWFWVVAAALFFVIRTIGFVFIEDPQS
ncbi:MAG: fibronectin type III domain-containing protein [Patescibacteria group bacterium]